MPDIRENFDATEVRLDRASQGVEASAGTGKTYSIAILALRMVIEKDIPVNKILMVTFTRAAVAELELRVRAFIRAALEIVRNPALTAADDNIRKIVMRQAEKTSLNDVRQSLERAVSLLDETAVLTIHSFCQRVLKEFSFETMQAFGTELLSEEDHQILIEDHFHDYWRTNVATLHPEILKTMLREQVTDENGDDLKFQFTRDLIFQLVRSGLAGKKPFLPEKLVADFLTASHQQRMLDVVLEVNEARDSFLRAFFANEPAVLASIQKKANAKKLLEESINLKCWDAFVEAIWEKNSKNYIRPAFELIYDQLSHYIQKRARLEKSIRILSQQIAFDICSKIESRIGSEKDRRLSKTFDDLIVQVRYAVTEGPKSAELKADLREQFHAVFIDEFQDTDADQYRIFKTLFGQDHFLFFIGDPKQSIYGWRKADLQAYFHAVDEVQILHRMNVNHRSNEQMIKAMNMFFKPEPEFDTFRFGERLTYLPVVSPEKNEKGILTFKGEPVIPIMISEHGTADDLKTAVADLISQLVWSGDYHIVKNLNAEPVKFSDIGILVRSKKTGQLIKKILAAARIPAVTVDDTKILESREAKELYYILTGILDPSRQQVNRAMLTMIAGYTSEQLAATDEETIIARFRRYQETWKSKGVYVMLQQFLADHDVHAKFYQLSANNAERMIANVLQLVDLLHRISVRRKYDLAEQVQWLKKGTEGSILEGDEYIQRIESDEESVRIVTIHKSKGLEYPIVICPELNLGISNQHSKVEFQTPDGTYMVSESKSLRAHQEQFSWYTLQQEQENRRLLYVAITRARQQCFILTDSVTDPKEHTLRDFLLKLPLEDNENQLVRHKSIPKGRSFPAATPDQAQAAVYNSPQHFNLLQKNWRRTSFTRLTPEHASVPLPAGRREDLNNYEQFVFRKLRKGAVTGNLLHSIFERINFASSSGWSEVIKKMASRFQVQASPSPAAQQEFEQQLNALIREVIHTAIFPDSGFRLADLEWKDRLTEMEFDVDLKPFRIRELQNLAPAHAPFKVNLSDEDGIGSRFELEGIMNGLMDLFFEWEGKFYILDWKSNYLGEQLEDYGPQQLAAAMEENNYHLQYHLYTLAACRYIRSRIRDFDYDRHFGGVIYLFIRGVRQGKKEGIFFTKPERRVIEGMDALFSGEGVGV